MKLLLDENFNNNIMRALLQRRSDLEVLRVQDKPEIAGTDDPTLLAWAAEHEYILLTHDVRTITKYAYERVKAGLRMPGVVEVKRIAPIPKIVDELLLLIDATNPNELEGVVTYIPM
ncbi:MAG: DUF5615 family PIN-like protein [Anaerolineae bacterium]|nr:DUF5615 family PIN-like protein [Anaerolineae bacterium]MDQ7037347.1 DUF5615 family PIN-like protein [Anaerolineae bacterium]